MFKVSNLTKVHQEKKILKQLSFEVDLGHIGIFLGGSGVGKTTLLRVLNNLENYSEGSFYFNSKALNLSLCNRDQTIGMVFQHFNLFEHLTVEENMILALITIKKKSKKEALQMAEPLLERFGLLEKKKSSIHKLSGGQKQRLAIARTLILDPKIICLDEPTSALDPKLTGQVADLIHQMAGEGRVVLLTTHDMSLLEKLKAKLFLMREGSIVEKAEDYFSNPTSYPLLNQFIQGI